MEPWLESESIMFPPTTNSITRKKYQCTARGQRIQWKNALLSAALVVCLFPSLSESFSSNKNNNNKNHCASINHDNRGRITTMTRITGTGNSRYFVGKAKMKKQHRHASSSSLPSSATENDSSLERSSSDSKKVEISSPATSSVSPPATEVVQLNGKKLRNGKNVNGKKIPQVNGHHEPSKIILNNTIKLDNSERGIDRKLNKKKSSLDKKQWKRRHARSVQEGIRRETTRKRLSTILFQTEKQYNRKNRKGGSSSGCVETKFDDLDSNNDNNNGKQQQHNNGYAARTISGLITALAEEAEGLEVDVESRKDTPLWGKHVEEIRLNFARLGFKPLRISGLDSEVENLETAFLNNGDNGGYTDNNSDNNDDNDADFKLSSISCADEAFDRMDVDNSGALDIQEIATALKGASAATSDDKILLEGLASELVELYDINGDGVVDREEYQSMVEDMAAVRKAQQKGKDNETGRSGKDKRKQENKPRWFGKIAKLIPFINNGSNETKTFTSADDGADKQIELESLPKGEGSIIISDLKLDLRRLVFGGLPVLKKITPGGPLILEPFTMTVTGSFNSEDVSESFFLDANLRRLVVRVLRLRVRSLRDFADGAVFYGRAWKMTSATAPVVEVPKLTKVEFDAQDRMILTGRALVKTSPDAPTVEQAFKLRCRIGTRGGGQFIRLVEPELALVIECPQSWEESVTEVCNTLTMPIPDRPEPIYSFFPIYSPFKLEDSKGFDLGPDNRIKAIYVKDGALRFEMSAVLRPGRFLGNHYVAFNIPQRTFIVTMDRVRECIRAARKNKREAMAVRRKKRDHVYRKVQLQTLSSDNRLNDGQESNSTGLIDPQESPAPTKSFFSRFVQGYLNAQTSTSSEEKEAKAAGERTERLTAAISDWFGRQGGISSTDIESVQDEEK